MVKKQILLAAAGIISCTALFSQEQAKHELSLWGTGGISTLKANSKVSDNKNGMGGAFGIGYNYSVSNQWSIGSGLELSFYNAKSTIKTISDSYDSNDGEYNFEFRTAISNYEEKQNAMYLNIPVIAQFQKPAIGKHQFYAAGGFKFGIPISQKYEAAKVTMENSGYYAQWSEQNGRELIMNTQEFMGFGTFQRNDVKGDLKFKVAYFLSLETGMKWNLDQNTALYTGAYFDYGLNNINKVTNKRLIKYNKDSPSEFINNSVISSQYTVDGKTEKLTNKVFPTAIGLKIKLAFNL